MKHVGVLTIYKILYIYIYIYILREREREHLLVWIINGTRYTVRTLKTQYCYKEKIIVVKIKIFILVTMTMYVGKDVTSLRVDIQL